MADLGTSPSSAPSILAAKIRVVNTHASVLRRSRGAVPAHVLVLVRKHGPTRRPCSQDRVKDAKHARDDVQSSEAEDERHTRREKEHENSARGHPSRTSASRNVDTWTYLRPRRRRRRRDTDRDRGGKASSSVCDWRRPRTKKDRIGSQPRRICTEASRSGA